MTILDLGSWCILRMASADTLKVARSLTEAGLHVWTPIEKRTGRKPRTRTPFDKDVPLMPCYAFGRAEHTSELLRLAMIPNRQHPRFTVVHHKGGIPLIADRELDALRHEEQRSRSLFERLKRRGLKGPKIKRGTIVRMSDGAFAGLSGVVEDQAGQYTLVSIEGFHEPIKIASLLLAENMQHGQLPNGNAARAA